MAPVLVLLLAAWVLPSLSAEEKDAELLFFEALRRIQAEGLSDQGDVGFVREAISAWLERNDRWGELLPPDRLAAFDASRQPAWAGIGVEVLRSGEDLWLLFPYPEGPAHAAGIREGDVLTGLAGRPAGALPAEELAVLARGEPGTEVSVEVRRMDDTMVFSVPRARVTAETVFSRREEELLVLRITRFGPGTARDLRRALRKDGEAKAVVLDLRGNPGGDFDEALGLLAAFLPEGTKAGRLVRRDRERVLTVNPREPVDPRPLFLLQDENTASSAELVIAALAGHRRAISLGRPSFGKGSLQELFRLHDGSGILLTTHRIVPPDGPTWEGVGLSPTYPVEGPSDRELRAGCLAKARRLLSATGDPDAGARAETEMSPLGEGSPAFAIESRREGEGGRTESVFYRGEVVRAFPSGLVVRVRDRYRAVHDPKSPAGIATGPGWSDLDRRIRYGPIDFDVDGGRHRRGARVYFPRENVRDGRSGLAAVLPSLFTAGPEPGSGSPTSPR